MNVRATGMTHEEAPIEVVLERLRELRSRDAPTHGGRTLSYVYDSGLDRVDELAGAASELTRPLNGLDPLTFPTVAVMERELIGFMRRATHGPAYGFTPVVGSVTSGGTESCLLAVLTARELWRKKNPGALAKPRVVAPASAHAAFQKAAKLFDLEWHPVPLRTDGSVSAEAIIDALATDVALVVVSAPAYPTGQIDPVGPVSEAAHILGISCHVDACFGGLALPWWSGAPVWDFRNRGVTSLSADLHKFGYAPKGVSVLLQRGRARQRAQFFATTRWPGYPVVNPTLLGSKSASPLSAAWAITQHLGSRGFAELTAQTAVVAAAIAEAVADIRGLTVWGTPTGPALALIADESVPVRERVDPHHFADAVTRAGFRLQHQPGVRQHDGTQLPRSVHLTITPVTQHILPELIAELRRAADAVRGRPPAKATAASFALRMLGFGTGERVPGPGLAWTMLRAAGLGGIRSGKALSGDMAPLMALIEAVPAPVAEALLTELLARVAEPQ